MQHMGHSQSTILQRCNRGWLTWEISCKAVKSTELDSNDMSRRITATMFDLVGKTKFSWTNRGLVTANMLETCTISPTRIPYTFAGT